MEMLNRGDPDNSNLIIQAAKFEQAKVPFLLRLKRTEEAEKSLDRAISALEGLRHAPKPDNAAIPFLADAILARAELARSRSDTGRMLSDCEIAKQVLGSHVEGTTDYALLALQVRAHICTGDLASVTGQMRKLESMGYREARYARYISTHTTTRGN